MHQPYAGVGTPPQPSSLGTPMYQGGLGQSGSSNPNAMNSSGTGQHMNNSNAMMHNNQNNYQQHPQQQQQQQGGGQRPPNYYQQHHQGHHQGHQQGHHHQQQQQGYGRGGPNRGPHGGRGGYNNRYQQQQQQMGPFTGPDPVLVPTRPLLKALAHECKPYPPWSVGGPSPATLNDELQLFAKFLAGTAEEKAKMDGLIGAATTAIRQLWPAGELKPMGLTAANVHSHKDTVVHLYAAGTEVLPDGYEASLRAAVNAIGFQADFFLDCRGCNAILLTEARTGDRCSVRFGPKATMAKPASDLIATVIASKEQYRIALVALEALLRQNKMIDDTGANLAQLSGEALAIMVVSIITSYSNDTPEAGRLLIDFFLTYGFQAHFDVATQSICPRTGMAEPLKKVHADVQLSIVDPTDERTNLSPKTDKVPLLLAVFNYCYTAMSQFEQVEQGHRRAQSPLSTIIGGEAYWSRVLQLYQQKVSPFYEVVRSRAGALAHHR